MKRNRIACCIAVAFSFILFSGHGDRSLAAGHSLEVLATTFPIYQITRNITQGRSGARVSLMIPASLGCPHDYALTPRDMQTLSRADVLVINGLGMEEFLGAPLNRANSTIKIIDSSRGIKEILDIHAMQAGKAASDRDDSNHHDAESDHDHLSEKNPHLFASPRMVARLAETIARGLADMDRTGSEIYFANARTYSEKMNRLADQFISLGRRLENNRIVSQHAVFDYLARDAGLQIVAVVQSHAGQAPSAAGMIEIIKTIKRDKAGALFTEPQYDAKVCRTIAREAGIPTATLDSGANGPSNAPLDYYETIMRKNLTTLGEALGTRKKN